MLWDHIIKNGTIVTSSSTYEANIYIKDGKILLLSKQDDVIGEAKEITDAKGFYILPGLIDTHVHSRDGGATYKEDFYHSTKAAAAGGVTTIFEMPNTLPTVNNVTNFDRQAMNFAKKANVNFGLWGICLGDINNDALHSLSSAGVIGFKYFWGYAIDKETFQLEYNYSERASHLIPPLDDGEVYDIFETVAKTGKVIAVHAENSELIHRLTKKYAFERDDYRTFLRTRPNLAEELTIQTAIAMAKATGARLHILHVSTKEGVQLIKQAQEEGYSVTAETCPHYLFLSNNDYERIGSVMKVYPPVKYKSDQDALWEAIIDGTISVISSDHAPHLEEEKQGSLWSIPAGVCGVETMIPLLLNEVSSGKLSLQQVVALTSENPAKLYDIYPTKGAIQIGADADFTIVDMEKSYTIKKEKLHSKSKVTPYDGMKINGMPIMTFVNGTLVMKNGEIVEERLGKQVYPNK